MTQLFMLSVVFSMLMSSGVEAQMHKAIGAGIKPSHRYVYISGIVHQPGAYSFQQKNEVTLAALIQVACEEPADRWVMPVTVRHRTKSGAVIIVEMCLCAATRSDLRLQRNDQVYVGASVCHIGVQRPILCHHPVWHETANVQPVRRPAHAWSIRQR